MPHLLRRCIVPCFRHGVYCTSPACTAVSPVCLVSSSCSCRYARCHMSILAAAALAGSCYKNVRTTACLTCCEDASCRASGMVYIAQVQLVQQFLRYVCFRPAVIAGCRKFGFASDYSSAYARCSKHCRCPGPRTECLVCQPWLQGAVRIAIRSGHRSLLGFSSGALVVFRPCCPNRCVARACS